MPRSTLAVLARATIDVILSNVTASPSATVAETPEDRMKESRAGNFMCAAGLPPASVTKARRTKLALSRLVTLIYLTLSLTKVPAPFDEPRLRTVVPVVAAVTILSETSFMPEIFLVIMSPNFFPFNSNSSEILTSMS